MSNEVIASNRSANLRADCSKCFGLCCVALPYAESADFAFNKDGGVPCGNLMGDYRCSIHEDLRISGFRGCTVYECFGAGQKVSQFTYKGKDWRSNSDSAKEMFNVFPVMQQLFEMLCYMDEALSRKEAQPLYPELKKMYSETEALTNLDANLILSLDVPSHRAKVNHLLLKTSELVRTSVNSEKTRLTTNDLIGANLKGKNLSGQNLRGALMIAADLREADLRFTDFIGADLRDADLRGANLSGSIFLTQAQVNSAKGNKHTKLPSSLSTPEHWLH